MVLKFSTGNAALILCTLAGLSPLSVLLGPRTAAGVSTQLTSENSLVR